MILRPAATMANPELYRVTLPDVPINFEIPKVISTSRLIGGGSSVSIYKSSLAGEQRSFRVTVPVEKYRTIKRISDSSTDEWLLMAQGRIFKCVISLLSAIPDRRRRDLITVVVEITIISEES